MATSLVTKAEYKAYVGVSSTNLDATLDVLIPKVSELVKSICRRTFVDNISSSKTEYTDGGNSSIEFAETPLISLSSLGYSEDYGVTFTTLIPYVDYVISNTKGNIIPISASTFPYAVNGYRLIYTGGYSNLPEDLKLAVFDLITYYIKNDAAVHSSRNPGNTSVQIEYVTSTGLPSHIKRILDLYTSSYD